jgi:hypothetical protein
MNPLNYGTYEACQRLVDAGIVVETEAYWWKAHQRIDWILQYGNIGLGDMLKRSVNCIPALSMAEAWRELPKSHESCPLTLMKDQYEDGRMIAGYLWGEEWNINRFSTNPTDALIDLIIWTRKEGKDGSK